MHWVRRHCDGVNLRGVARVVGEPGRFAVSVEGDSWRPSAGGGSYSSSAFALAVADVLARRKLGGHVCGEACTGWAVYDRPYEPERSAPLRAADIPC
jgi:hypothetical protein